MFEIHSHESLTRRKYYILVNMHGTFRRASFFAVLFLCSIIPLGPAFAELKTTTFQGITVSQETADKLKGGCDSDPYPYLEQRHKGDRSNSFVTPRPQSDGSLKNGLDPALACRLKKLMEAAEAKGCRLTVNSAMRPKQRCNPGGGACARQGNSCHQYGLAADLGGTPQCLQWLTSVIGRKNPNSPFKLHVAYVENGNYRHVQCSEHLGANRSSCRGPCDGGTTISPDVSNIPNLDQFSGSKSLADAFRQATGIGQPAIPPQPAMPPQPMAQQQQPGQYFQPNPQVTTQPSTVAQPGSPVGTPSSLGSLIGSGSSGNTSVPVGIAAGKESSDNPEEERYDRGPSIGDQLLVLAYGTSSVASSTEIGKSVPIVVSEKDAMKLKSSGKTASSTASSTPSYFTGGTTTKPTQTFISGDLTYGKDASNIESRNRILAYLADLKTRLLRALEILRPFGLRARSAESSEHSE